MTQTQSFDAEQATKEGPRGILSDGREYFVVEWSCKVSFENLISAGKIFGQDNVVRICLGEENSIPLAVHSLMSAEDNSLATALIENFVSSIRIDGSKISSSTIDKEFGGDLYKVIEAFVIVLKVQYAQFFGAVTHEVNSQSV